MCWLEPLHGACVIALRCCQPVVLVSAVRLSEMYVDNATFGALQLDYGSVQRVYGSDVERLLHDEVDAIVNCPWVPVLVVVLPVIMRGAPSCNDMCVRPCCLVD